MSIIINWVDLKDTADNCIELPLYKACFSIHSIDNIITRTEWNLAPLSDLPVVNGQWKAFQHYLNNPTETLTISLKIQGSVFKNKVWAEMCEIPVGQTLTYSALAKKLDSGARAVANACRDNPYPIIIPCHRVVAVSGFGGYMGQTSGRALDIKKKLLANELCFKESGQ